MLHHEKFYVGVNTKEAFRSVFGTDIVASDLSWESP